MSDNGIDIKLLEKIFGGTLISTAYMATEPDRFIFLRSDGVYRVVTAYEAAERIGRINAIQVGERVRKERMAEDIEKIRKFNQMPKKEQRRILRAAERFAKMIVWEFPREIMGNTTVGDLQKIPDAIYSEAYAKQFLRRQRWERTKRKILFRVYPKAVRAGIKARTALKKTIGKLKPKPRTPRK